MASDQELQDPVPFWRFLENNSEIQPWNSHGTGFGVIQGRDQKLIKIQTSDILPKFSAILFHFFFCGVSHCISQSMLRVILCGLIDDMLHLYQSDVPSGNLT